MQPLLPVLATILALSGCASTPTAPAVSQSGLNGYRLAAGLLPMQQTARLDTAARAHADDMARRGFFSHQGSNGSTHSQRIAATGYKACVSAENIASGQPTRQAAMDAFFNSTGHRRNMLNPQLTEYGYALSGNKHVLVLARPC